MNNNQVVGSTKKQDQRTSGLVDKECDTVCSFQHCLNQVKLPQDFFEMIRDKNTSVVELESMINTSPDILVYSSRDNGFKPLHYACLMGRSYTVIELLVQRNPDMLQVADASGNLPLHYARYCCGGQGSSHVRNHVCDDEEQLSILKLLADPYPLTVQHQNEYGETPLYMACQDRFSLPAIEYLTKCCPQSLQVKDNYGYTPFHAACCVATDLSVIPLLHTTFPWAARWKSATGATPFASAYPGRPEEVVEYLAYECWPIACPLLYMDYVGGIQEKCLEDATRETVAALIDVAFHVKNILPHSVVAYIAESIMPTLDRIRTMKSSTKIRPCCLHYELLLDTLYRHTNLDFSTVLSILKSEEIQCLLKPESGHDELQELIDTVIRMNRGGRAFFADNPDNKRQGMKVLQISAESVDGLFYHIRENPQICKQ